VFYADSSSVEEDTIVVVPTVVVRWSRIRLFNTKRATPATMSVTRICIESQRLDHEKTKCSGTYQEDDQEYDNIFVHGECVCMVRLMSGLRACSAAELLVSCKCVWLRILLQVPNKSSQ
jgi:hypothetical protein